MPHTKRKTIIKKSPAKPINLGGRPTVMTEEVLGKLIDIFKVGGTTKQAVAYARIGERTFYDWYNSDEGFRIEIDSAKSFADIAAKKVVADKIIKDKDDLNARWWLEKREFKNTEGGGNVDNRTQNIIIGDEHLATRLAELLQRFDQRAGTQKTSKDEG